MHPRLRLAIAQFDAVMRQAPLAGGPHGDAIDVQLNSSDEDGSQTFRVTYTSSSVFAKHDQATGESEIRQGPSFKVDATLRLVCPESEAEPVAMEIGGVTQPFDASDARVKIERILMDKVKVELQREARKRP